MKLTETIQTLTEKYLINKALLLNKTSESKAIKTILDYITKGFYLSLKDMIYQILSDNKRTLSDIEWIGNSCSFVDIDKFLEYSSDLYSDFGDFTDIKIVGCNFCLKISMEDDIFSFNFKEMKEVLPENLIHNENEEKSEEMYEA